VSVVEFIRQDPVTFSLPAWIALNAAPRDTRPPPPSIEKIIRIATAGYKQQEVGSGSGSAGVAGAADAAGANIDDADVLVTRSAGGNLYALVDNPVRLRLALEALTEDGGVGEAVAVDLEGVNLGDIVDGIITSVQLCRNGRGTVYIVDLLALGKGAFVGPYSLRDLLEDADTPKLFWDCRTDGRALHHLHGIKMQGVVDLQLLQIACFAASGREVLRVQGLGRAIAKSLVCCSACACSCVLVCVLAAACSMRSDVSFTSPRLVLFSLAHQGQQTYLARAATDCSSERAGAPYICT
jgi:hypothetical protein